LAFAEGKGKVKFQMSLTTWTELCLTICTGRTIHSVFEI